MSLCNGQVIDEGLNQPEVVLADDVEEEEPEEETRPGELGRNQCIFGLEISVAI